MSDPERIAAALCRGFLGWRLREDYDALLALEEGSLWIDLRSGEAWCDGDPLPPLFIAGELQSELEKWLAKEARFDPARFEARLDAIFAVRTHWLRGREHRALDLSCRVTLRDGESQWSAEANNAGGLED